MKRHIPGRIELAVLLLMALACTLIVRLSPQRDTALFACTLPVFLVASLMGFRRFVAAQMADLVEDADDASSSV